MHTVWGILMMTAGLLMLFWGSTESTSRIYRMLADRSKILWGDNVHRFYQLSGIAVIIMGVLVAFRIIGR